MGDITIEITHTLNSNPDDESIGLSDVLVTTNGNFAEPT